MLFILRRWCRFCIYNAFLVVKKMVYYCLKCFFIMKTVIRTCIFFSIIELYLKLNWRVPRYQYAWLYMRGIRRIKSLGFSNFKTASWLNFWELSIIVSIIIIIMYQMMGYQNVYNDLPNAGHYRATWCKVM